MARMNPGMPSSPLRQEGAPLSPLPRTLCWLIGAAMVLVPLLLWATGAGDAEMTYPALIGVGVVLGVASLLLGVIARPGDRDGQRSLWIWTALGSMAVTIGSAVAHNVLFGLTNDQGGVAGLSLVLFMLAAPVFVFSTIYAVLVFLLGDGDPDGEART